MAYFLQRPDVIAMSIYLRELTLENPKQKWNYSNTIKAKVVIYSMIYYIYYIKRLLTGWILVIMKCACAKHVDSVKVWLLTVNVSFISWFELIKTLRTRLSYKMDGSADSIPYSQNPSITWDKRVFNVFIHLFQDIGKWKTNW